MATPPKSKLSISGLIDFPLALGALLTAGFYLLVNQDPLKNTLLHHYTTEHVVEYVVVFFFIWGLVDIITRALALPFEKLALRQEWLPPRTTREPVENATELAAILHQQPKALQKSRIARRLHKALAYLQEKGSADGFNDYLKYLAIQDEDQTHTNYGLTRFICWVAPVLGILGTVIHFGSAFGGLSVDQIGDNLAKVVGEIGTAFNTTTVALAAAITMMLSMFLCERAERGIVLSINRRTDSLLLNRFEVVDESLTPFIHAVQAAARATLSTTEKAVQQQLQIWSAAFNKLQQQSDQRLESHAQLWEESLTKIHQHFEHADAQREKKLLQLLGELQTGREQHKTQIEGMSGQIASLHAHLAKFVEALAGLLQGEGELVRLQSTLATNLRLLEETSQIDQALHGLTAAIHLLTGRYDTATKPLSRAA
jgi:biopolymer transport protein ExbB/TolQ